MSNDRRLLASFGVAATGALWGLFWIPVRHMEAAGVGGAWPSLIFFTASVGLLLPWQWRALRRCKDWQGLVVLGLLTGGAFALYIVALLFTDVIRAILLFYITPVWSTLLSRVVLKAPITPARIGVLLTGFAGLWIILGADGSLPLPERPGDWMALFSGMCWAAGSLVLFRGTPHTSGQQATAFVVGGLAVTLVIMPFLPFTSSGLPGLDADISLTPAVAVGIGTALVMMPANFAVLWGASQLEPARVGILLMLEVVVGVLSAAAFAGEPFSRGEAVGAILIVGAGILEVVRQTEAPPVSS
jgi:drug/metabolite transporter (DMT)-like permease